jgi:hypothetical protein
MVELDDVKWCCSYVVDLAAARTSEAENSLFRGYEAAETPDL